MAGKNLLYTLSMAGIEPVYTSDAYYPLEQCVNWSHACFLEMIKSENLRFQKETDLLIVLENCFCLTLT